MRLRYVILAAVAVAASVAAGCGGSDDNGKSFDEQKAALEEQASLRAGQSAKDAAATVKDKHLPGGVKRTDAVCTAPELPEGVETGYQIQCHVEAFSGVLPGRGSVFIWSEDWSVPVDQNGKLGTPVISGEYRIKNYLRRDNRLNCSGHVTRPEVCQGTLSLAEYRKRKRLGQLEPQPPANEQSPQP
jgi:hypothetical protein